MVNDITNGDAHGNESYRFGQITDPHLSSPSLSHPWRLCNKRILGYLSWLKKRRHIHQRWVLDLAISQMTDYKLDHLVVTGDLTHIGLENEFEQASKWLQHIGKPNDVTVIPGNHDLYVNEYWHRTFAKWQPYLLSDQAFQTNHTTNKDALSELEKLYPTVRIRKNLVFIGVSSVFAAPWFRATGYINESQLNRLEKLLQQSQLKHLCKVLLIHHPISTQSIPNRKRLLNSAILKQILKTHPVQIILHGHGHTSCHEFLASSQNTNIPVIGLASASSVDQNDTRKAELSIYEVSEHGREWKFTVKYLQLDFDKKKFMESHSKTFTVPVHS